VGVKQQTPKYALGVVLASLALVIGNSATRADSGSLLPIAPDSIGALPEITTPGAVDPATITALVTEKLTDPRLGANVSAYVIDANSKAVLVDIAGDKPMIPASTLKSYTAIAALQTLGSQTRFATRIMQSGPVLTLVGGGDPTLVSVTPAHWRGKPPGSEQPPSLEQLADKTVAAIGADRTPLTINFDDSLFTGPNTHESWPSKYLATGEVASLQGLTMDFGINDTEAVMKDPAKSAAQFFVDALVARGVPAVLGDRKVEPADATEITRVESATVIDIVERMITTSNNTMAEFLAHQIGGTEGDYSFAGGARVTARVISEAGIDTTGLELQDGSGLSQSDRTSAKSLTSAISYANQGPNESWAIVSGLPIAGISGTLNDRYGPAEPGRGTVRAKTGTLSGVVSLTGTFVDASGDLLIFAIIANDIPGGPKSGEAALDDVVKAMVQCGCRVA
jgi:D-alanyl-D-alanine carboxypeptidase/D-alanyl-D-alanine-endopeptidase (penicillin-binding protein 4)